MQKIQNWLGFKTPEPAAAETESVCAFDTHAHLDNVFWRLYRHVPHVQFIFWGSEIFKIKFTHF